MRWALLALALAGCGDPADFRPAKGVADLPAVKTAYRIHDGMGCDHIGYVTYADSLEDIAETVANHGGTHFTVLNDYASTSIETKTSAAEWSGVVHARSSSRAVKHHRYTAEAFRCAP